MAEKKSELKMVSCDVEKNAKGELVLKDCLMEIKGSTRKMLGTNVIAEKNTSWTCDLSGMRLEEALLLGGSTLRIKMQTIRDRDDFVEVADRLDGSTVKYDEIDTWTDKGGQRMPVLGKWLLSRKNAAGVALFSKEKVTEILANSTMRAKAQAKFDELMAVQVDLDL